MKTFLLALCFVLQGLAFGQNQQGGKALYLKKCASCHGDQAQGLKAEAAPSLRGQFDWYIISSIEKFLSGERKNPKMLPYLKGLTPQDFKDIAAYLSKLE